MMSATVVPCGPLGGRSSRIGFAGAAKGIAFDRFVAWMPFGHHGPVDAGIDDRDADAAAIRVRIAEQLVRRQQGEGFVEGGHGPAPVAESSRSDRLVTIVWQCATARGP